MKILTLVVGQLRTNCYLVISEDEAVVIDPGDEASYLSEKILSCKVKVKAILATHGHFDHVLGASELKLNFKAPFMMNKKDLFLLKKSRESALYWTGVDYQLNPAEPDGFLKQKDKIEFGKEYLEVIETPGHTPGGISFYSKKNNLLFSGDIIFKNGFGRTDFSYGNKDRLCGSIKRLLRLPKDTLVYPGHGDKTSLKHIKKSL